MKKTIIFLGILFLLFAFMSREAFAAPNESMSKDVENELKNQLSEVDLDSWNSYYEEGNGKELFGYESITEMVESYLSISREDNDDITLFDTLLSLIKCGIKDNLGLIAITVFIGLAAGTVKALLPSASNVGEIAGTVICAMAILIIIATLSRASALACNTVDKLCSFSELSAPVASALLISSGELASAGTFSPTMSFLCTGVMLTVKNILLPIVLTFGVISIVSIISGASLLKQPFSQLQGLSKSTVKWSVGFISVVYTGIVVIKGLAAKNYDKISIKTAKFLIDKSVPVAGSFVAGTADTVIACASAVKGAVGIATLSVIALLVAIPLIELLCLSLTFRVSAVLCEPVSDEKTVKLLSSAADTVSFLFGIVFICASMFMITFGLLVAGGA